MVDALGPTGVEGVFRRTCEAVMATLRREADALMPVLNSFVYDPLAEPERKRSGPDPATAARVVSDVESRLRGQTRNVSLSVPLSVEGQVHALIADATNVDKLCEMYIGWAPFI